MCCLLCKLTGVFYWVVFFYIYTTCLTQSVQYLIVSSTGIPFMAPINSCATILYSAATVISICNLDITHSKTRSHLIRCSNAGKELCL